MELSDLTLTEAADLIKKQTISPPELTQAYLDRIASIDKHLNCFITLNRQAALQAAHSAQKEIEQGNYRGPLHGIPIALKDLYETNGMRTTAGSKFFRENVPIQDAFVVQKLKGCGAILLGKLNMHEIALGVTNVNPHYGACHNPWNLERISGGSSGGSAAALAARLCLGSLGSDTGGSIRIPASLCGIVGLKPTYGRVSLRGVIPLSWNLDHAGPMARCVRDAALLLQHIAGYDPDDPYSIDVPADQYLNNLEAGARGWRVALASDEFFEHADPEVLQAVQRAAQVFEKLEANLSQVEFPGAREAAQANSLMTPSDAAAFHHERLENSAEDFGADVRQRLQTGAAYTSSEYILARRTQTLMRRKFAAFFDNFDILLTPATAITAPLIEGPDAIEQARRLTRFTAPFNLTGLPAISVPCGFSTQGLPVGLQIVAAPWAEAKLLRAAYAYEQATDWHTRRPEEAQYR
jgi:aspartyl-tRNA(Asn)/glutamyl-tRNA(Gln) amidotransferase subunit A